MGSPTAAFFAYGRRTAGLITALTCSASAEPTALFACCEWAPEADHCTRVMHTVPTAALSEMRS
jgi:hypothetical protein